MDDPDFNGRGRVGSVKAAINLYGDRIADSNSPSLKKTQVDFLVVFIFTELNNLFLFYFVQYLDITY